MKETLVCLMLIVLTTASCQKSNDGENSSADSVEFSLSDESPIDPATGVPTLASTLDANVEFVNFNSGQQDKMEQAIEIIKLVVATVEFRARVLEHTYNGTKTFVDNGGNSNSQIYQKILEGAERLQPAKNNSVDAEVELYYDTTNVVGYTYATSKRIWVNTKYFNSYSAAGVAHNLFHEWLHKLGFNHASTWSPSRDFSVPYAIGYIIEEIGKDFL